MKVDQSLHIGENYGATFLHILMFLQDKKMKTNNEKALVA